AMATLNTRMTLVCAGLAVFYVLLAPAAQAQDVSFIAQRTFAAGFGPQSVAVGDFNGDGVLDLAVASRLVSIHLGNGDGSFQAARIFPGPTPSSVAVGDFNGDGQLDLAAANQDYMSVSVFLGNGDGSFQPARSFPAGVSPISVAVGDFNGDG